MSAPVPPSASTEGINEVIAEFHQDLGSPQAKNGRLVVFVNRVAYVEEGADPVKAPSVHLVQLAKVSAGSKDGYDFVTVSAAPGSYRVGLTQMSPGHGAKAVAAINAAKRYWDIALGAFPAERH